MLYFWRPLYTGSDLLYKQYYIAPRAQLRGFKYWIKQWKNS